MTATPTAHRRQNVRSGTTPLPFGRGWPRSPAAPGTPGPEPGYRRLRTTPRLAAGQVSPAERLIPGFRQHQIAFALLGQISEAGEVHVHPGDQLPIGGDLVKDPPTRCGRLVWVGVKNHGDLRARHLYLRHVDNVAPDQ